MRLLRMNRNGIIGIVVAGLVVVAAIVAIVLATSSDDSDDTEAAATATATPEESTTTTTEATTTTTEATTTTTEATTTTTEAPPPEPLRILVTNDDGIESLGIAALADAVAALDNVEVLVVAPLTGQSGSGDESNGGPYEPIETETATGMPAIAIDARPADMVLYVVNETDFDPHVVVSGSNDSNNLGPTIQVSGTVGAARTAGRNGVPGLAVSNSAGEPPQYENSVGAAAAWVESRRADLLAGALDPIIVTNINGPTCESGETKGLLELPVALEIADLTPLLGPIDCAAEPPAEPTNDIEAVHAGYVVTSTFDTELSMFG